jgi:hypothetical protein
MRDPDWALLVGRVAELTGGDVIDPAVEFASSLEWLALWPSTLNRVGGLVLVPGIDAGLGAGCLREIADVLGRDRPVCVLDGGRLVEWSRVGLAPVRYPSRFRVATIVINDNEHGAA